MGTQPGGSECADHLAVIVHPLHLKCEQVLERDGLPLHAGHLSDVGDLSGAVPEPAYLYDEMDGGYHLLPHGPIRQIESRHQHHILHTAHGSRLTASRGVLAWTVLIEPSCPVFIAWSISNASPPRTSPMMMRSGRMRRALRTRSR